MKEEKKKEKEVKEEEKKKEVKEEEKEKKEEAYPKWPTQHPWRFREHSLCALG